MKDKKNKPEMTDKIKLSKPYADEAGLTIERAPSMKITVKTFREGAYSYFSSPCMLSEIEEDEDILDRYF